LVSRQALRPSSYTPLWVGDHVAHIPAVCSLGFSAEKSVSLYIFGNVRITSHSILLGI
jgi:hypothetical protein